MKNKTREHYLSLCKVEDVLDWFSLSQIQSTLEILDRQYQEAYQKQFESVPF